MNSRQYLMTIFVEDDEIAGERRVIALCPKGQTWEPLEGALPEELSGAVQLIAGRAIREELI